MPVLPSWVYHESSSSKGTSFRSIVVGALLSSFNPDSVVFFSFGLTPLSITDNAGVDKECWRYPLDKWNFFLGQKEVGPAMHKWRFRLDFREKRKWFP